MKKTIYHSWKTGELAEGCKLCVQGKKLVLFITGKCSRNCWYCPISEKKWGTDDVYANEWKVEDPENPVELFEEIRLTGATGAGITGGDPLCALDRTVEYIRLLKEKYGEEFHIHLYTPLKLATEENLRRLHEAGLDEIRFHPDLKDEKRWGRIDTAIKLKWDVGIEIPAIPGYEKETKKLIDYIAGKVKFLNLNELERSDTSAPHYKLDEKGYAQKDNISYGIKGSEKMALEMVEYAEKKGLSAHYCTAKLKDSVQLKERITRRAKNIAHEFDRITEEGLLIRGACYLPGLQPGIDYKKRLEKAGDMAEELQRTEEQIKSLGIKTAKDEKRHRVLMSTEDAQKHKEKLKELGLAVAIVEEYPAEDATIAELEFI